MADLRVDLNTPNTWTAAQTMYGAIDTMGATGSLALMGASGMLNRQMSGAGISPTTTGGDYVLAVYSLPANALNQGTGTTAGVFISAIGSFAATANVRRVKVIWAPTAAVVGSQVTVGATGATVSDTGAVTGGTGGWVVQGQVFKLGAPNSNTQIVGPNDAAWGTTGASSIITPASASAVENAAILIAVTGNATTTATDIVFNMLTVQGFN